MTTALVEREPDLSADVMEKALLGGDLAKLSSAQRLSLYQKVCESLGLNPLTRPFEYITLNGKLTLYAKRDCTDQLRKIHRVSIAIMERGKFDESVYVVRAQATKPGLNRAALGRTDEALGAVNITGLKGENLANALMKAETKAKRRVTLSICGLGWLDETEAETLQPPESRGTTLAQLRAEDATRELPTAEVVDPATGEVLEVEAPVPVSEPEPVSPALPKGQYWIEAAWKDKSGKKRNGQPWTLYKVRVEGIDLSTFSDSVYKQAQDCIDQKVPAAIETTIRKENVGTEITKLTVMERPDVDLVF